MQNRRVTQLPVNNERIGLASSAGALTNEFFRRDNTDLIIGYDKPYSPSLMPSLRTLTLQRMAVAESLVRWPLALPRRRALPVFPERHQQPDAAALLSCSERVN